MSDGSPGFRHDGVPYYSQWADPIYAQRIVTDDADPCGDPSWRQTGFDDAEHYRFWSRRICGLACLRSALAHWRLASPAPRELLEQALRAGCYVPRPDGGVDGLIYAPFVRWIEQAFGLRAEVWARCSLQALVGEIKADALVIASVSPEIRHTARDNERKGGHLVLVHGQDASNVWLHNPSGGPGSQADARLTRATFARFYAERGIVLRRA